MFGYLKIIFIVSTLCVLSACAQTQTNRATTDKLSTNVASFPPSISELTIVSNGDRMSGIAYLAAGEGPHPTILLLHGYPGNEKNLDVAQAMRRKGWNVIFFHYRGAWGSEGEFSYRGAEQDVQVVLDYMASAKNSAKLKIDIDRVSIVGHSMGGHMAIAGILDNPNVQCAVSFDGANLGAGGTGLFDNPESAAMWKAYSDSLFMLSGWSGDKAVKEIADYGTKLDLVGRVNTVNNRPILLVAADTDVIPLDVHIKPLQRALMATGNSNIQYSLIDDDHSFSASRLELIETTATFLNGRCR